MSSNNPTSQALLPRLLAVLSLAAALLAAPSSVLAADGIIDETASNLLADADQNDDLEVEGVFGYQTQSTDFEVYEEDTLSCSASAWTKQYSSAGGGSWYQYYHAGTINRNHCQGSRQAYVFLYRRGSTSSNYSFLTSASCRTSYGDTCDARVSDFVSCGGKPVCRGYRSTHFVSSGGYTVWGPKTMYGGFDANR